ncbi:MAG: hypothetical protein Q7J32_10705 [Sphingomonadaceae bacterium]|nr:hypothetical protein [Sphingomonadaceae bacterium]
MTASRANAAVLPAPAPTPAPAVRRTLLSALTAPLIYSLLVPIALLDLWVTLYQQICFRVYGVPRVRRADYLRLDRHRLPYLDAVGKLNCVYCGYANGVIAYAREVASRSEQYWCPIKHGDAPAGVHHRYAVFAEFGDGAGYDARAERLREALRTGRSGRPPD